MAAGFQLPLAFNEAPLDHTDLENVVFRNNQSILMQFLTSGHRGTYQKAYSEEFCTLDDISDIGQPDFSDDVFRCLMLRKGWFDY